MATQRKARGTSLGGSRVSSARFEIVSSPVYAIIATGIASRNWVHVGATPSSTLFTSVSGLRIRTKPSSTRRSCVAKSSTASRMFSVAASRSPTTFRATSATITIAPPMMSHGFSRSGSQKTER